MTAFLSRPDLFRQQAFVAGHWCAADNGAQLSVRNPASGELLGQVPALGEAEVQRAIAAAVAAQREWARTPARARAAVLHRWHAAVLAHREDLAQLLTREQGRPLAEARGEIDYGASFIDWFAEEARRAYGNFIPSPEADRRLVVQQVPVGVVAAITPWNFPSAMITRKAAPALAAGCAVLLKPAPQTPFSALALARLAEEAGLPAGLLSVLTGEAATIGEVLTRDARIAKLSFTGSTATGRLLMAQCAPTLKRVSFELGGNAPFIVFEDADLDAAVAGAMASKFRNNGQTCVCANRFFVHEAVHDAFVHRLADAVRALKVGDGLQPGVALGPLIDQRALEKVEAHVADALAGGARLVTGGQRHALGGQFFEPTVLVGATSAMRMAREETFGPVAAVYRFADEAALLAAVNDCEQGLAAYLYSRDVARCWRVAEALECGMVGINTGLITNEVLPFGGVKQSGMGREGSPYGLAEYLETRSLVFGGIA